jgi:hypothetical protein
MKVGGRARLTVPACHRLRRARRRKRPIPPNAVLRSTWSFWRSTRSRASHARHARTARESAGFPGELEVKGSKRPSEFNQRDPMISAYPMAASHI